MTTLSLQGLLLRARSARVQLTLEPGLHVLSSTQRSTFSELFPCILGLRLPRRGRVLLGGVEPYRTPELRARIGALLPDETEPEGPQSVSEYVARVDSTRGRSGPPLQPAGHATLPLSNALLARASHTLGPDDRRRIALALALTTPHPALLLLHEPLSAVESGEEELLLTSLNEHVAAGALVVLTTCAARVERRLGATIHELEPNTPARGPVTACTWLLRVERPRDVASILARSPLVYGTQLDPLRPRELRVHGREDDALSDVIQAAIVESRCEVTEISHLGRWRTEPPAPKGAPA